MDVQTLLDHLAFRPAVVLPYCPVRYRYLLLNRGLLLMVRFFFVCLLVLVHDFDHLLVVLLLFDQFVLRLRQVLLQLLVDLHLVGQLDVLHHLRLERRQRLHVTVRGGVRNQQHLRRRVLRHYQRLSLLALPPFEVEVDVVATQQAFQFLDPLALMVQDVVHLLLDVVIRIQFLLQLENRIVSLVQSCSQRDHDVPLLQQELLVLVRLRLVLLDLLSLLLQLLKFLLVLLPDDLILLLQRTLELRSLFHFLSSNQHLRLQC